jgi:hypothetical protein
MGIPHPLRYSNKIFVLWLYSKQESFLNPFGFLLPAKTVKDLRNMMKDVIVPTELAKEYRNYHFS